MSGNAPGGGPDGGGSVGPPAADFDSPWKDALERYLKDFMELCFPEAYAEIDWDRGYRLLDKELQRVVRDAALGRRLADKLVQVWRKDGEDAWVLVHVEVQGQEEADFAQRMFVYWYRIFDRYKRTVVSLAVLSDERSGWRPTQFAQTLWGCTLQFTYPVVKLLDYRRERSVLEGSDNPFATVVLAHLAAQETQGDDARREDVKKALARRLFAKGYERQQIVDLYHFIDWLLELPPAAEERVRQEIARLEEELHMPYISTLQRQGQIEGMQRAARAALEGRFGPLDAEVTARVAAADEATLLNLMATLATATLEDVRARLGLG